MSNPTSNPAIDVCDFNLIYNEKFQYCVSEKVVKSFFEGKSFGRTEAYSSEEIQKLSEDINSIYSDIMKQSPVREKLAVITAGSPGAGKTTLMHQYLERKAEESRKFAYVDPDDVCLRKMNNTWGNDLIIRLKDQNGEDCLALEKQVREEGYNKWRPGSNAAAHLILANLIRQNYAFYFGSTSSNPLTSNTFKYLKEQGYQIHLIHLIAPDDVRWDSIKERDKLFVQTTEEDIREKGKLVPQRINDTYLKYADKIDFYYRDQIDKDAVLTSVWVRITGGEHDGELAILDPKMYKNMVSVHNTICSKLSEAEQIQWEQSVERVSNVLQK